ncbi:MAG: YjhG/YagF family D-xylonate dehydratase [Acidobacteriota bacterium]|nr:YjhG/YagF family D-xylonate dehydratase [Acidobacteriota bacterium]
MTDREMHFTDQGGTNESVTPALTEILDSQDASLFDVRSKAHGPQGSAPISPEMLLTRPSGDLFGWSQNAGMGWSPNRLGGKEVLILSTHGGIRREDGTPIALGYHTGHWEVGLLMQAAAEELSSRNAIPFAAYCTDPCDGRTQGTTGMFDSLPYRNDAATIFRRLIRSLPTRSAVIGVATCDKGLPAMMLALASMHDLPCVLIPGGVTLLSDQGEDAGRVQSIGARFAHNQITLEEAAENMCRACASPGGGCQFLGTAATSQVVAEALGMSLTHSALAPSGQAIWLDMARRSARAALALEMRGIHMRDILTDASVSNAMLVHAAFGGSTNLILHLPAVAHAAHLRRPTAADWTHINREVPRIVDALPNGPRSFPTVQVFLAGGVPEVMLHLRRAGLLDTKAMTVSGEPVGAMLDWWEQSERRQQLRRRLLEQDGVDPGDVIMDPVTARDRGLTSTVTFPHGNLAPGGSVIKSTSIDPSVVDPDGVYRKRGRARIFQSEADVIAAVKSSGPGQIQPGEVIVLICRGPMGSGMEEIYQITSALKHLAFGKHIAVITDARFSGVSTGACIGHITPEALAGGPVGKLLEGDLIEIVIDRIRLEGTVDLVGEIGREFSAEEGTRVLASRPMRPGLAPDPRLPDDTRLWAALQNVSGGTWGGCVFDTEAILAALKPAC